MRTIMLVGRTHCGKTTFCQALFEKERREKKTQTVEILDGAIDTPGEYFENRRLYRALMVTSIEAEVIVLMQDCTDAESMFPPLFATMFSGKPVLGVVSKVDLGDPDKVARAREILAAAGADPVFTVCSLDGEGITGVRAALSG